MNKIIIFIGLGIVYSIIIFFSGLYIGKYLTESDIEKNKRVIIHDFLVSLDSDKRDIIKFGKYVFIKNTDGSIKMINTNMNFIDYEFIINGNVISIKKKEEKR